MPPVNVAGGIFNAQPPAEEVCRRSGAWGARRVGKDDSSLLDCKRYGNYLLKQNAGGTARS